MLTTAMAREYMIKGQLFGFLAAILTSIPVTVEYLDTSQLSLHRGTPNQIDEPNYGRKGYSILK